MVARLKLKEIDGRAPPGVSCSICSLRRGSADPWCPCNPPEPLGLRDLGATHLNCWDPSKASGTSHCLKGSGTVTTPGDVTMSDQQPRAYSVPWLSAQRSDGCGHEMPEMWSADGCDAIPKREPAA